MKRGPNGLQIPMNEHSTVLDPLDQFYLESGLPLPPVVPVTDSSIPEPQRSLLVHRQSMTSRLEAAYGEEVRIKVLNRKISDGVVLRQVVLIPNGAQSPVEFGAIRIHLEHLSAEARKLIGGEKIPLGRVLRDLGIQYLSRPMAYFQLLSDALLGEALELSGSQLLYGRRNRLLTPSDKTLAEVVEILPPKNHERRMPSEE
ncbi:MAG: hypothetical protein ACRD1R_09130 [Acidobacteriota bacterium]